MQIVDLLNQPLAGIYALRSFYQTFIQKRPDGFYSHEDIGNITNFLTVKRIGDTFVFDEFEDGAELIACAGTPKYSVRRGTQYFCAQRDGMLWFNRLKADLHEQFILVPMTTIRDFLSLERPKISVRRRKRSQDETIPNHIHQTYKTQLADCPPLIRESIDTLIRQNPDCVHKYWSDNEIVEFIRNKYGMDILRQYLSINPSYGAGRADLFRYLLIYAEGGIYLDTKSGCRVPISSIIQSDDTCLLRQWSKADQANGVGIHPELRHIAGGEYQQWWLAASPGHIFLKVAIEATLRNIELYNKDIHGTGKHALLKFSGPIVFTLAISEALDDGRHRFLDTEASGFVYNVTTVPTEILYNNHYSESGSPIVGS